MKLLEPITGLWCASLAAAVTVAGCLAVGAQVPEPVQPAPAPPVTAAPVAPQESPPSEVPAEIPAPDDPRLTAGGVLKAFMAARDYRTIRALKGTMTPALVGRFDQDSTPFCGKRGIRLAVFHFTENDLRAQKSAAKQAPGALAAAGGAAPAVTGGPSVYIGTVRSLWEEQGEAFEKRTETVRVSRQDDGLWRVAALERGVAERLRFTETINGITTLRMVLRAWHKGDFEAARGHLSSAFLKKYAGREEALRRLFVPENGAPRHAAYRIVSVQPQGETAATAEIRLFRSPAGEPSSMDGAAHTLRLVKSGARWLVDSWK